MTTSIGKFSIEEGETYIPGASGDIIFTPTKKGLKQPITGVFQAWPESGGPVARVVSASKPLVYALASLATLPVGKCRIAVEVFEDASFVGTEEIDIVVAANKVEEKPTGRRASKVASQAEEDEDSPHKPTRGDRAKPRKLTKRRGEREDDDHSTHDERE